MERSEHFVYVITCKDGSYYAGYTNTTLTEGLECIMKEKGQSILEVGDRLA